MSDFFQNGVITTLHDLRSADVAYLERVLLDATRFFRLGLILPVTASDMRAEPFSRIVAELRGTEFLKEIVVVLGVAPDVADYRECLERVTSLGEQARVIWTDGPRFQTLYKTLIEAGLNASTPGKGRSVWTAYGYLLAEPKIKAYALHDCDIATYSRELLLRLCLPIAHPTFDFQFCKAYYARFTDRLHGRVVRLLVSPLLRALISCLGPDRFLTYLDSFRYPLSGEFAVTADLARSNRIPGDWGLEVGTLAEVYRNVSAKRVCQVDICPQYEHKHQSSSLDDPSKGLLKMATDILSSIFRTLSAMGTTLHAEHFTTIRSAYLRNAQDAIRQYAADAVMNGLVLDRHEEEVISERFAQQIVPAGEAVRQDPTGTQEIPNWARVLSAYPEMAEQFRIATEDYRQEF
ncbi:MAG: glycosyl transferase, partial [Planctomycetes bacterium]|nr:glycosyl transferase [Planctomycetota bacterium]